MTDLIVEINTSKKQSAIYYCEHRQSFEIQLDLICFTFEHITTTKARTNPELG